MEIGFILIAKLLDDIKLSIIKLDISWRLLWET